VRSQIRPILGFWGSKVFQQMGDSLPTMQNLTPLALFLAEKSVTVPTHKITKEQTNSKLYIHTLPIGMCG